MRRVGLLWVVAVGASTVMTAGCSGGAASTTTQITRATSSTTSSARSTPSLTPSPSESTAPAEYDVGDVLTGQEFSAQLLERTQGSTVLLTTTSAGHAVTCVATVGSDGAFLIPKPVAGIEELRVIGAVAYVQDRAGSARSWLEVDLTDSSTTVPSKAVADALNLANDVGLGDCRGIDRYAAIDATGEVKVKAFTGQGWTLSAPTDPKSQGTKNSESKRTYVPATWKVDIYGRPVSYKDASSSANVTYSHWDDYSVEAPPDSQVRK